MKENIMTIEDVRPSNIDYAFFTNENGHSDAGYLINGQKTRNVNLRSSEQKPNEGFDPAHSILANIQMCFEELGAGTEIKNKFFMASYYANMGNNDPLIISCKNSEELIKLKQQAVQNLDNEDEDESNPNCLGLEHNMKDAIKNSDVSIIRADALIFKGIPGESIAVLGGSGDAHPIMMFDDEHKIACYISGGHMTIKQGVLEQSFERMIELGAEASHIRLVIGPGLGAKSYEFGNNAPEYFSIQEQAEKVLKPVKDSDDRAKYLIDIKELVTARLKNKLDPENIYNIELDTMGFDLYEQAVDLNGVTCLKRRTTVNFEELNESGLLFFGARRTIMQQSANLMEHNPGAYNTVGRQAAGFVLK